MTLGCKDIGIRKSEFVAKSQFLYNKVLSLGYLNPCSFIFTVIVLSILLFYYFIILNQASCFTFIHKHVNSIKLLSLQYIGGEEGQPQQLLVRATFSSLSRPNHLEILVLRWLCVEKFLILEDKTIFNKSGHVRA